MKTQLIDVFETENTLGESPVWDDVAGVLWWTDIQEHKLFRCQWATKKIEYYKLPSRLTSFGLTNISSELIGTFESGFALLSPIIGAVNWINRPEETYAGRRFNDGRVDRQGRFWAGTMVEDADLSRDVKGKLYRLDKNTKMDITEDGLSISNGLCWNLDSTVMYLADSARRTIFAFDFASETGAISNKRVFAQTPDGMFPDGADVDAEGFIWSAQWGANRVVRYAPGGSIDYILGVPVTQPSSIAFGGRLRNKLFVTSAREGLSDEQLAREANAGNVLVYQTNVTAPPAPRFALSKASRLKISAGSCG